MGAVWSAANAGQKLGIKSTSALVLLSGVASANVSNGRKMMRIMLITTSMTLGLMAAPASAQLLGGGGLGSTLGGTLNGTIGTLGPVTSGTTGSISKSGSIRADKSIDRRSGRVQSSASGSGSANGSASHTSGVLGQTLSGSGSGGASGSGAGNVDAQLIGTDTVRGVASNAVGTARNAAGSASGLTGGLGNVTGSAAGQGSGSGSVGYGDGALSGTGEWAGSVAKNINIAPGTLIEDARGRVIGAVQDIRTNAKGAVQMILVRVGDAQALVPVGNFSVSGDGSALVSAMGKGQLQKQADQQEKTQAASAEQR
jgi:hypothetical protein